MIAKPSEHKADGGEFNEIQCGSGAVFEVLCKPATTAQPSECPLDDPAFGQNFEARGLIGAFDDFDLEFRQYLG